MINTRTSIGKLNQHNLFNNIILFALVEQVVAWNR